jgi:hypothetical protein
MCCTLLFLQIISPSCEPSNQWIAQRPGDNTPEIFPASPGLAGTCADPVDIQEWLRLGAHVARHLQLDPNCLSEAAAVRVYHYYLPLYFWVLQPACGSDSCSLPHFASQCNGRKGLTVCEVCKGLIEVQW